MKLNGKIGDIHMAGEGLSSIRVQTGPGSLDLVILSMPAAQVVASGLTPGRLVEVTLAVDEAAEAKSKPD